MFSYFLQDYAKQKEDAGHVLGKVEASRIRFIKVKKYIPLKHPIFAYNHFHF